MALGAIVTAAQFVAQNETAQQLGIAAARRLGGGIYARVFGAPPPAAVEEETAEGASLIAVSDKLDRLAKNSATRDEMAHAFMILQNELASRQRRMVWALGGLAATQLVIIGLLILR